MSGYAGGHVPNPSYEQVCGKGTGHAEVVQVGFDPAVIGYADLLRVFFTIHDPTTKDRQGADVGPQYRSIILAEAPEQAETARSVMAEVEQAGIWGAPLVTELVPAAELLDETMKVAEKIASMSKTTAIAAKQAVNRSFETTLEEGLLAEQNAFYALFATEDQTEGMAAFAEKRRPEFRGE